MSFEFKIGQEFRVIEAEFSHLDDNYDDGDIFTIAKLDSSGDAWDADGDIYINQHDVASGYVKLIENHEIEVGDVYEVIDDTGVDNHCGKMWNGNLPVGSNFTINNVNSIGEGYIAGYGGYFLQSEWVGTVVKFLYNIHECLKKQEEDIPAEEITVISSGSNVGKSVFESTIYDETYDTFEEAVVNETFYELMETFIKIKTERGDFLEHLIDQLTYEQRKEMVKYTLGIKQV